MFKVEVNSIRDNRPIPMQGEFITPIEAKAHVEKSLRGLSSYWQAWVLNSDGQRVVRGYRAGRGQFGERWTWKPVVDDPPTR